MYRRHQPSTRSLVVHILFRSFSHSIAPRRDRAQVGRCVRTCTYNWTVMRRTLIDVVWPLSWARNLCTSSFSIKRPFNLAKTIFPAWLWPANPKSWYKFLNFLKKSVNGLLTLCCSLFQSNTLAMLWLVKVQVFDLQQSSLKAIKLLYEGKILGWRSGRVF